MVLDISGVETSFEILDVIEFDSTRKRMSVIIRTKDGIHLYCKGADNVMFERLSSTNSNEVIDVASKSLIEFSNIGLRTLVICYRLLTDAEYESFSTKWRNAQIALTNRDEEMDRVSSAIECDLIFLGCTAIEDKLQHRVPETIEYLLKAKISLWLLTGDKQETAINIGMSSRLITSHMTLLILSGGDVAECERAMDAMIAQMKSEPGKIYALVVNGDVLAHVFKGVDSVKFLEIGCKCRSVICTRVTPLQKALVVRLVKKNRPNAITLAIGDGANDVSMIQEAHIGVGIMGKEGTQAVRAADYAFGEFRFLQRLLTVHGRYNLLRLSNVILYSFYKNFVFIFIQFLFGFFNNWSGQLVYEELFFTAFNVVFTSFPPLLYAIYERDLEDKDIEAHPELYIEVRNGLYWSKMKIAFWFMMSIFHAGLIFLAVYFTNSQGAIDPEGKSTGYWVQCYLFSTPMLLTITSKLMINTRFYVWIVILFLFLSILASIIIMFMMIILDTLYYTDYATSAVTHALPGYYLLSVLMPAVCIVPDIFFSLYTFSNRSIKSQISPSDTDIMQERRRLRWKVFGKLIADFSS